jgi:hypothetical protein
MTITIVRHDHDMPAGQFVPGGGAVVKHPALNLTAPEQYASTLVRRAILRGALGGERSNPGQLAHMLHVGVNGG